MENKVKNVTISLKLSNGISVVGEQNTKPIHLQDLMKKWHILNWMFVKQKALILLKLLPLEMVKNQLIK